MCTYSFDAPHVMYDSAIISSPVPCLHKDFILGGINTEEYWFLSRIVAMDGTHLGCFCGEAVVSRNEF